MPATRNANPSAPPAARSLSALLCLTGLLLTGPLQAAEQARQDCMAAFLETGADDLTLGEIRRRCAEPVGPVAAPDGRKTREDTAEDRVARRLAADRDAAERPFSLLAHRPNYILLGAWNERGWDPTLFQQAKNDPTYTLDDVETQFQLSFQVPLFIDRLDGRVDVYAAYTNRSFWQAYNREYSQPFRETNHEPEVWVQFHNRWNVLGLTNVLNAVGVAHQSNGQSGVLSRGWDRVYANFVFEREGFALSIKPWWAFSIDGSDQDNPDIEDYMGHGEIRAAWLRNGHVYSAMVRNQLESGFDRGAVELGWSFPVFDYPYLKGYLQYFYGYGESLIDYDRKVNRIGLGISLTDWLD